MSGEIGAAEFTGAGQEVGGDAGTEQEGAFFFEPIDGAAAEGEQDQKMAGGVAVGAGQGERVSF
ncbi:hypothetical protein [Streptomyces sp. MN13]